MNAFSVIIILEELDVNAIDNVSIDLTLLLFYFSPYVILSFSKKINAQFKLVNIPIKVVDLLIPYLLVLIYVFDRLYFQLNLIPYLIIILSVMGIGFVSHSTFVKKTLNVYNFLRLWWRYVFLILMATHIGIGVVIIYQIIL